jgi:3-hydroxyisobutyrate dehydrogenase
MGEPMARNLLHAGYRLFVFNRTRAKAERLISEGATWADSPALLAAEVDIVISIVSDSLDAEVVYLGEDGVCAGLRAGSLCIDMSTIAPETAGKLAGEVHERGGSFLDAPVSGGRTGAEAGTLSIMVGGAEADVARARPVFEVLGKRTVHGGVVGSGQLMKMCNQIVCAVNLLAVCEAVVLARRMDLDAGRMLEAISGGAAGSWALDNLGPRMLRRDFAPMFMIDLQQKDLRIALEAARKRALPLPGTSLVSQLLTANQAMGEGGEGTQALVKTIERLGNVGCGAC